MFASQELAVSTNTEPNPILVEIRRQNRIGGWKLRPRFELRMLDAGLYRDRRPDQVEHARRVLSRLAARSRR